MKQIPSVPAGTDEASLRLCAEPTPLVAKPHPSPLVRLASTRLATFTVISLGPPLTRFSTQLDHSVDRGGSWVLGAVVLFWFWVVASTAAFLIVVALFASADSRMLPHLWRGNLTAVQRYMAAGIQTFFKLVRDHQTPRLARSFLVITLIPWLLPWELIPEDLGVPWFLDELAVAFLGAKGFVHLCPDALIRKHAATLGS
jgi:hypothetical protein